MNYNRKWILVNAKGKKIAWSNDIDELSKHLKLLGGDHRIIPNPKYDKKEALEA